MLVSHSIVLIKLSKCSILSYSVLKFLRQMFPLYAYNAAYPGCNLVSRVLHTIQDWRGARPSLHTWTKSNHQRHCPTMGDVSRYDERDPNEDDDDDVDENVRTGIFKRELNIV